jgi:hypothetical protein
MFCSLLCYASVLSPTNPLPRFVVQILEGKSDVSSKQKRQQQQRRKGYRAQHGEGARGSRAGISNLLSTYISVMKFVEVR